MSGRANAGDTRLALEIDYATPIAETGASSGTGGSLRLGQKLDLPGRFLVTPEAGGSFQAFAGPRDAMIFSGFCGGRLGLGFTGLEPALFVHAGLAKLSGRNSDAERGRRDTGPSVDAGFALTLTLLPYLDVGAHATYANLFLDAGRSFDWFRAGLHGAVVF